MYWELSLVVSIFEMITLFYVFQRSQYIDYYFGLFFIPFTVQQFCQVLILALDANIDINECGVVNQIYSNVILIFIYTVPLFVCFTAFRTNMVERFNLFWKLLFIIEFILYISFTAIALLDDYNCAYLGNHGHLSLQFVFYTKFSDKIIHENVLEIILIFYYFLPFILSFILYKPLWIIFIPYSYLLITFIILRLFLEYESYAVWCLSSVMVCIWMIIYVPITRYMIKNKYFEVIDSYDHSMMKRIFLNKSYSHLINFEMLNGNQTISDDDNYDSTANQQEREPFQT